MNKIRVHTTVEKRKYLNLYYNLSRQIKDFDRIKSTDELIYNLLNDYKQSREQITKEILRAVFQLEDIKQQRVLYIHFIEGKTWEKVAEIMQYEYRHIIRIAKQAIENLPDMEVVDLWQWQKKNIIIN